MLHEMTEHEQRMSDDFTWAENAVEIQQNPEHFGKLVAVYNKRVVGVGRDRQTLVEQAAKEIGVLGQYLVVVLVPRPGLWEILNPKSRMENGTDERGRVCAPSA